MYELIFLWILALIWIVFAVVQDLKTREIANWLNFSLIVFALGYRFFYSLFSLNWDFFYSGVFGLIIFFILGNVLYYSRLFAGGDAKLMIALGAILPFSNNFIENLNLYWKFLVIFLITGGIYTLLVSFIISLRNFKIFKREVKKQFKNYQRFYSLVILISLILVIFGIVFNVFLIYFGILMFILPYLHLYAKSIDEGLMIKKVDVRKLTEGDWLYKDVKIGRKTIKANWDGLSKENIALLKKKYKNKKINIRFGIPFSPVFLISLIMYCYLVWTSNS